MEAPSLSIFVWGIFFLGMGASLALIPGIILPIFGFEKPKDFWIRVLGIVVFIIGYYYVDTALHDLTHFFWLTVYGRYFLVLGYITLVVFKVAKPALLLFGAIEVVGASWTLITLLNS